MVIIYLLMILAFFICLYIAAWQDAKNGSVSLMLLMFSAAITIVLSGVSIFISSIYGLNAIHLHFMEAILVLIPLHCLLLYKKMGGADVLIFVHITALFGLRVFVATILFASLMGLIWALYKWAVNPKRLSLVSFRKQELRFIPFIAIAVHIVMIFENINL